jgi:AcrR family transcriptional regulator
MPVSPRRGREDASGGRPKKLADAKQLELARALDEGGQTNIATICATLGISRATLYRYLKNRDGDPTATA